MKRWIFVILLVVAAAGFAWLLLRRSTPPEVAFAKVKRETLVSLLSTNGKTEPLEWAAVSAPREGRLTRIEVERGQHVAAGQLLAILDGADAQSELAGAEARLEQVRAELSGLRQGGRASELADIDGTLNRLKVERDAADRDAASLARLVEKQAATRVELDAARDRLAQLDAQIQALRSRRGVLVSTTEISVAEARLKDAEAAVAQSRRRLEQAGIRSPRSGVVYELPAHTGVWLAAGDLVAKVGDVSKLRVMVYVDEPDLGRVRRGLPVTLTWDAQPAREWTGSVEKVPVAVTALGTRQVGEVATIVENPAGDLPPGANINVKIRADVVENALSMPKSALRRENGELGVYALESTRLAWRKVTVGVTSETRAEARSGLKEGDSVALPSERTLKSGMETTPLYP